MATASPTADNTRDPNAMPAAGGGLASRSFSALILTQALGAVNDNMLRWLVIGISRDYVAHDQMAYVLSAGLACFVFPYLLLAAPAGYLADRFAKRHVIVACKFAEVVIMLLAVVAILASDALGNIYLLFAVVFLMGSQSALFSPSKFGSIPELVRVDRISAANGVMALTTVLCTMAGSAAGMYLSDVTGYRGLDPVGLSASALLGVAILGFVVSLGISAVAAANPSEPFPWRAVTQTIRDLRTLASDRGMLRVALGISLFWALGSLAQMNIERFGAAGGMSEQSQLAPLLVSLVIGVALGSVLAGIWSGGKVELGILPLGAGGIAFSAIMLFTVRGELISQDLKWTAMHVWACVWLFTLGIGAGLFDVPLNSYMQHRSPRANRGSILAASNFMSFAAMLGTAILFVYLSARFNPRQIFLLSGLCTLPVFVYVIWLLPLATMRFVVWLASHTVYRVKVFGRENLPETGGALLVANHVSWVDGVLLLITSSRPIRMMAYAPIVETWWLRWLTRSMKVITIDAGPKKIRAALESAREAVKAGELVCIFPEGQITRTGLLQGFKRGLLKIVEGTGAPVVPVYLDGLWGSIFSYRGGRLFWKWPRKWPYPVAILFGKPIAHPEEVNEVREAVQTLGVEAVYKRKASEMNLPLSFIKECRRAGGRSKVADSTGAELSGRQLLIRALVFRRLLLREVLAADEKYVGLLLPPSAGAVLANVATSLCGRVPVNLNYTVSSGVMNNCIEQCGIKNVLASRKLMEKLDLQIDGNVVYLEDFRDKVTTADKMAAALSATAVPTRILARMLGLRTPDPDDIFTIIFTSGSTGEPKGVMLTVQNIASNIEAVDAVVNLRDDDVLVGILPFFHSFGFSISLWTVLTLCPKGVYHFNPLDAREIGKLCERHKATLLLATPTFLRTYLRRCQPEQLKHIDTVLTGAERLPPDLADAFEKKFGVRPSEGYGTTELSPLVSVNVPPSRASGNPSEGAKEGTVGRTIPHVMAKVIDPDTGDDLGLETPGMLLIKGPNVMKGYLNKPEQTAEVLRDGWYVTGDVATIDADGFITITGRMSRFSKIGGEMVPHLRLEEMINEIVGEEAADDESDQHATYRAVVTAVPDERKGERLVVLHLQMGKTPEEVCRTLQESGLPPIWVPSQDSFFRVDQIPVLGTGKLDLQAIKEMALEKTGPADR